jgi:hypothetical protein
MSFGASTSATSVEFMTEQETILLQHLLAAFDLHHRCSSTSSFLLLTVEEITRF